MPVAGISSVRCRWLKLRWPLILSNFYGTGIRSSCYIKCRNMYWSHNSCIISSVNGSPDYVPALKWSKNLCRFYNSNNSFYCCLFLFLGFLRFTAKEEINYYILFRATGMIPLRHMTSLAKSYQSNPTLCDDLSTKISGDSVLDARR